LLSELQHGFTDAIAKTKRAAQYLDRKVLLAGGIVLAICASASYLLLNGKRNLVQIEEIIEDRLGFLEEPLC
jgi:hypothetical protein